MTSFKQDTPMDVHPIRLTAAHARRARKIGSTNASKGIRDSIELFDMVELNHPEIISEFYEMKAKIK